MVAADPGNAKWQLEAVYAATNLGTVELEQRRYETARKTLSESVVTASALLKAEPGNGDYRALLIESLAYLADANERSGRIAEAIANRSRQLAIVDNGLARGQPDEQLRQKGMIAHMAVARLLFMFGQTTQALTHAAAASAIGERLVAIEPTNADWRGRGATARLNQAMLLLRANRRNDAAAATAVGCAAMTRLHASDPSVVPWRAGNRNCLMLRAELAVAAGESGAANALARQLLVRIVDEERASATPNAFAIPEARKLIGDMAWRGGDRGGARAQWLAALTTWPKLPETPAQMAARGEMLRGTGNRAAGQAIAARLIALGYRQSITNRAKI